ncbi:MAG: DNA polymerase III subunit beta [Eubacteriales bacterium]
MKIIFDKTVLLNHLLPAMGTVSTKSTVKAIEGVLIETMGGSEVRFSTYDMNKGVRTSFEALAVPEEGSCILQAQRFLQIIKLLGGDEITLSVDAKLTATISSGTASFSLYALKGEDFPSLPELSGKKGFAISSAVLKNKIGRVIHSVAEQDNRPMLCGVYFSFSPKHMELVSCDGYTLSVMYMQGEIRDVGEESLGEDSFIMPGHALQELTKIIGDKEETLTVLLARKHAVVQLEGLVFFSRLIDGEYMDYRKIMPKNQPIQVRVNRERLLEGLERASLIAEDKTQGSSRSYVKLTLEGDQLSLTSSSVNGRVSDEMPCEHEGEDIQIGFNCRYLINSIRAAEGERVFLTLRSATQSMTIEPVEKKENEKYFYMVLPLRMTE